jgi:hypothetical protein
MIKIEISSASVDVKSGVSARTGKPYSIREQQGFAYIVDRDGNPQRYPEKIRINLRDDQPPYAVGNYAVDARSFYVDRFDNLALGLVLRSVAPVTAAKAA